MVGVNAVLGIVENNLVGCEKKPLWQACADGTR